MNTILDLYKFREICGGTNLVAGGEMSNIGFSCSWWANFRVTSPRLWQVTLHAISNGTATISWYGGKHKAHQVITRWGSIISCVRRWRSTALDRRFGLSPKVTDCLNNCKQYYQTRRPYWGFATPRQARQGHGFVGIIGSALSMKWHGRIYTYI
jgi:hypothetical protein